MYTLIEIRKIYLIAFIKALAKTNVDVYRVYEGNVITVQVDKYDIYYSSENADLAITEYEGVFNYFVYPIGNYKAAEIYLTYVI